MSCIKHNRDVARCKININKIDTNKLFVDKEFEGNKAIYFNHTLPGSLVKFNQKQYKKHQQCTWERPITIDCDAKFVDEGFDTKDLIQGDLGDCWFISSLAAMMYHSGKCGSEDPLLINKIIPPEIKQSFNENYAGKKLN